MCGIAGIYAYREASAAVDRGELLRIREAMIHRGPDGAGLWVSENQRVGLAHRRLAIIDLSDAGAQPMATADGNLRITFNGEIYNYRELRDELQAKGHVFRTNSDTEVLLHLYADRGAKMVHALRGMFAFGIWDETRQELFLARDPMGIKTLYYADDGKTFRFATLVAALVEGGAVDTAEDVAGVAGFYIWGCVPDPHTCYRSIRALPAGTTLLISGRNIPEPVEYFSVTEEFLRAEEAPLTLSGGELRERIREIMKDTMRFHMVSDVPVGVFLSAGVDSNVLASLGAEINPGQLRSLTLGFSEYRGSSQDETALAEASAAGLGIAHTSHWIKRADFKDQWPKFAAAMDQASTDGLNSFLVSNAAGASRLKVAISGVGGDELFGGYPSFRDVPRMQRLIPRYPALGRHLRRACDPFVRQLTSPKYAGLLEYGSSHAGAYLLRRALYMPWELARLLGRDRATAALEDLRPAERLQSTIQGLRNERCVVAALELSWYMRNQLLRDSDWAGMSHAVEIRTPFVDAAVLRSLAPLIAGANPPTKTLLSQITSLPLLDAIVTRRKTGFTVPVREWMGGDLPRQSRERGLRGWSRTIGRLKHGRRFLGFFSDAYGGNGGIALHNRDLLQTVCEMPDCGAVVALPRLMPYAAEPMPAKLDFVEAAAGDKWRYLRTTARILGGDRSFDLVLCGHINLLPVARLASWWLDAPMLMFIHGIDAWQPTGSTLVNYLARRARWVIAVSEVTAERFRAWTNAQSQELLVNPNAIHIEWYGPGPKNELLLQRYGLTGKTVLMTLGRLAATEAYKGFDEVLDLLPELAESIPNVTYMIVGEGTDRQRLEKKASALGVAGRVIFTGRIAEAEKADHYRLADTFVMASRGEGFGFVLLEAMACGVPVIASKLDGGREALLQGRLGELVDPGRPDELRDAILRSLARVKGVVPPGLEHFFFYNFKTRTQGLVRRVLKGTPLPFGGA